MEAASHGRPGVIDCGPPPSHFAPPLACCCGDHGRTEAACSVRPNCMGPGRTADAVKRQAPPSAKLCPGMAVVMGAAEKFALSQCTEARSQCTCECRVTRNMQIISATWRAGVSPHCRSLHRIYPDDPHHRYH
jgi:hypothetical protein